MSVDQLPAEPQPGPLDEIIADYLDAEDQGGVDRRGEILARYPQWASELTAFFEAQTRVNRLVAPLAPPLAPLSEQVAPGRFVGGYEILAEFARGGMGVIYTARQAQLDRVVALKMILTGAHAPAEERQRFKLEATAAARLDHPNIVPVYEVGEADGLPFYSMKLIAGRNLAHHLGGGPLPPREAARLVGAVARAVGYAHDRGVLHRDLKPANILIEDGTGIPFVADFGLARLLSDEHRLTPPGHTVGTPAYLAPELLQSGADSQAQLTTAADVYALGAILYECLTGRPPFQADSPLATLVEIVRNQFPRPRAVTPAVPVDLETVCLKCLDQHPARRYPRAADLADELDRWQRGEPVAARPIGATERLLRWCRRQPVVAALAGGLAVSLVLGAAAVYREWRRAEKNYAASEVHRQTAELREQESEVNFRLAHDAVGRFYDEFSERHLKDVPGLKATQRKMLADARGYYERFIRQRGEDPQLRRELAAAHFRIAAIDHTTGNIVAALPGYQRALAMLESFAAEAPDDTRVRRHLALTLHRLAAVHSSLRKSAEAQATGRRARAMYEDLVRVEPDDLDHRIDLAGVLHNLGAEYQGQGRIPEAGACFEAKVQLCFALLRRRPDHPEARVLLARGLQNFAHVAAALGAPEAYPCCCLAGVTVLEEHLARYPRHNPGRVAMAGCLRDLASFYCSRKQPAAALGALGRARPLLDAARAADPEDAGTLMALSAHYRQLGHARLIANDPAAAAAAYGRAGQAVEPLAARHPDVPGYQDELGKCWFDLGFACSRRKDRAAAVQAYQQAADIFSRLCAADPGRPAGQQKLGRALHNLAVVHTHRGQLGLAVECYRRAVAAYESGLPAAPRSRETRGGLAGGFGGWAEVERLRGRFAAALAVARRRRDTLAGDDAERIAAAREFAWIADREVKGLPPEEAAACRLAADEAVACLRAIPHGAPDFARVRREPVFARLLDRLPAAAPRGPSQ